MGTIIRIGTFIGTKTFLRILKILTKETILGSGVIKGIKRTIIAKKIKPRKVLEAVLHDFHENSEHTAHVRTDSNTQSLNQRKKY